MRYNEEMADLAAYLEDYLNYLEIEKNRSLKTRENYANYLKAFLSMTGSKAPSDITEERVRAWRVALARKELKKITQSYYIIALRNFLKFLAKRDIKTLSPEKIELPKIARRQIDILDERDVERLLDVPLASFRDIRDKAVLEVLYSTGLRLAEICSLNRDIDIERGEFTVRGKGEKLRVVFLAPTAKAALKHYLSKRTDLEECLFVSLDKKGRCIGRITPRAVERLLEARARKAGVMKKVHPHQLRHSFATDLLINGADLRSVQEMLGHSNISTTQVYTHLTNKQLKEIHDAFHARRRKKEK